jgi:tRNA 2-thiouridine synthesizing protein E
MLHIPYDGRILNEHITERRPVEFLNELPVWNRQVALHLAAEEGIELTPEHWEVLHYLRRRLVTQGQASSGRVLVGELADVLCDRSSKRRLYLLFPGGPVTQGSRIAGLPPPAYHSDRSFGSVE